MAVYTTNIIIYTGTSFEQTFILADDPGENLLNLTGYSVISKMKKHGTSSSVTLFTTTVTDITGGRIRLSLTSNQTSQLSPGRYYYDLLLHKDNNTTRVIEGEVIVKKSVTRFD